MPITKNLKTARKKIKAISMRFDLSKCKKEYEIVEKIIEDVKNNGEVALKSYTKKFDKVEIKSLLVSSSEINNSTKKVSKELLTSIKIAIKKITTFQKTNLPKTWIKKFQYNENLGYIYNPIDSVGIYIPGGKAPLISTVLMTVIPAKVAGVKRIVVFSPPKINSGILTACKLLGISEIYQVGGAQAVALAAYGTKKIKPVNKIIGPGNIFVTLAKKNVFGKIGIDGLYGPSEIAIIADESAIPKHLAADLLSQLEHGSGLESAVLVTTSEKLARETELEVLSQVGNLPNKTTILQSWKNNSLIVVVKNLDIACELINELAPEHLEIIVKNPKKILNKIRNAGAIFIGGLTCESVGDYIAGPSHCLPTGGSAKFSSGLTVMDFMKKISYLEFNKNAFNKFSSHIVNLANAEGLIGHANAIKVRRGIK